MLVLLVVSSHQLAARSVADLAAANDADVLAAWAQLESACGSPMLVFPDEPEADDTETKENES